VSASNPSSEINRLISLVHHRWNILIIATLHRLSGAKFITLVHGLEVSRGSLRASLEHLIELGYVHKNTGHGHPMRPEYLLTKQGVVIGDACLSLVKILRDNNEFDLAFRKWTLPLIVTIGERRLRFNQLRSALHDATPRAIAMGLKSLHQHGWAKRSIIDEFPPTAAYELKPKGQKILKLVSTLCQPVSE